MDPILEQQEHGDRQDMRLKLYEVMIYPWSRERAWTTGCIHMSLGGFDTLCCRILLIMGVHFLSVSSAQPDQGVMYVLIACLQLFCQ